MHVESIIFEVSKCAIDLLSGDATDSNIDRFFRLDTVGHLPLLSRTDRGSAPAAHPHYRNGVETRV